MRVSMFSLARQVVLSLAVAASNGIAVVACTDSTVTGETIQDARSMIGPEWPQLPADRLTTSGEIYMANLESQIAAMQRLLAVRSDDRLLAQAALLLYHRFQVIGNLDDAEAARKLLSPASERGHGPEIDLAFTQILLGFHEFERAQSSLDAAESNGAPESRIVMLREAVDRATGVENAIDAPVQSQDGSKSAAELVARAAGLLDAGQPASASRLLRAAQDAYTDPAPYILAWIHVQQGIIFLKQEDHASANLFFKAAYRRFPQYTLAAEHLAETELALGNYDRAAELYRAVAERSGHPEFYHQLAAAERGRGNTIAAERFAKQAREGYGKLVEHYPLMYADHAVRYYVDIGEADKAVELAALNLAERPGLQSEQLLAIARECCR